MENIEEELEARSRAQQASVDLSQAGSGVQGRSAVISLTVVLFLA